MKVLTAIFLTCLFAVAWFATVLSEHAAERYQREQQQFEQMYEDIRAECEFAYPTSEKQQSRCVDGMRV